MTGTAPHQPRSYSLRPATESPSRRGTGLGRALLEFTEAEARRAGFDAIHLYNHEQMTENLALYSRIGYLGYDRRSQGAFSLVYMRASSLDEGGPDGVGPRDAGSSPSNPSGGSSSR
jgi:hypothetical protein